MQVTDLQPMLHDARGVVMLNSLLQSSRVVSATYVIIRRHMRIYVLTPDVNRSLFSKNETPLGYIFIAHKILQQFE